MAYKSKYYDPVKAHEYYEKHKKLKGRKKRVSTSELNDEGKAAAKEVKEAITQEKKEFMKNVTDIFNNKLAELKKQWKEQGLSKEAIKEAVEKMRADFKEAKAKVNDFYNEKYAQEMDKIKQDSSFQKEKKQKKKKSKKAKKKTKIDEVIAKYGKESNK